MTDAVRIDKWLWAVRLFKTRTLAAEACRNGHVRIQGHPVKASREVRVGEILVARTGEVTRTVLVLGLIDARVGAAKVPAHMEDLTPPEELRRRREPDFRDIAWRPPGAGRPTKRERRKIEAWLEAPPAD